jgi:hypothetical protein
MVFSAQNYRETITMLKMHGDYILSNASLSTVRLVWRMARFNILFRCTVPMYTIQLDRLSPQENQSRIYSQLHSMTITFHRYMPKIPIIKVPCLWIGNVNKFISRCHQRPCIIQVYQNNTWDQFIKMYEWEYPKKIVLTECISRHYTDHNKVFQ